MFWLSMKFYFFQTYTPQWLSLIRGSEYNFVFHGPAFSDSQWLALLYTNLKCSSSKLVYPDWYSRRDASTPCLPLVFSFIQWILDGFQELGIQDLHLCSLSLSLDGAELPQPQESYQQLHHLSLITGFSSGFFPGKVF